MERLNALDLVGDGDDVDILNRVENVFGVQITDAEAERTDTVGDLYDLVQSKRGSGGERTTACFSQIAFHRLRAAARSLGARERLTPSSPIDLLVGSDPLRKRWISLAKSSGLNLPALEVPGTDRPSLWWAQRSRAFHIASLVAVLICCYAVVRIVNDHMPGLLLASALVGAVGLVFFAAVRRRRRTIPMRIQTIGDLACEAAGLSFQRLMSEKGSCHEKDIWFALTSLCREENAFRDPIDRNTTFFAEAALRR